MKFAPPSTPPVDRPAAPEVSLARAAEAAAESDFSAQSHSNRLSHTLTTARKVWNAANSTPRRILCLPARPGHSERQVRSRRNSKLATSRLQTVTSSRDNRCRRCNRGPRTRNNSTAAVRRSSRPWWTQHQAAEPGWQHVREHQSTDRCFGTSIESSPIPAASRRPCSNELRTRRPLRNLDTQWERRPPLR